MSHETGPHAYVNRRARLLETLTTEKMLHAYAAGLGVVFVVLAAIWLGYV